MKWATSDLFNEVESGARHPVQLGGGGVTCGPVMAAAARSDAVVTVAMAWARMWYASPDGGGYCHGV